ncbi:MAG TPA: PDZ domain-containing protein [Blastocatellia bacterium]|nr:PDZ domain-containing protein [Blastocatellia bacterium]
MLKRFYLVSMLVAALGVGVAIAATAGDQKEKQKEKTVTADSQKSKEKEKEKAFFGPGNDSRAFFAVPYGEGSYLGVFLEEVTPERVKELGLSEERGAIVMKVVAGGPAEKAGLKENDVVLSFNGRRVDSVRELQRLLSETPAERAISIEVFRAGGRQTLNATLSKRSSEFQLLRPELADKEAMKRAEESFKHSMEEFKSEQNKFGALQQDFGNFVFAGPGQHSFFSGSRLGISVESVTDQLAEYFGVKDGNGVLIARVDENGAGAKAGLKAGDVIIAIDNEKIDSVNALVKALSKKEAGQVAVQILRNRSEQTVNVTIEKREQPPAVRKSARVTTSAASSV